jgi:hypothetical protein
VALRAKGFGAAAAAAVFEKVDPPAGGWPTISVILLSTDSTETDSDTLARFAKQDYPLEEVKEILVANAEDVKATAPEALRPLLRDLSSASGILDIAAEIDSCSGSMVAFWGDDHISPPNRLTKQVAAAAKDKSVNVLKTTWFYDAVSQDFLKATEWMARQYEEFLKWQSSTADVQAGIGEYLLTSDPLTICGSREMLSEAAKSCNDAKADDSPSDKLEELVSSLFKTRQTKILDNFEWAVARAPPNGCVLKSAEPQLQLVKLARKAFPKISTSGAVDALVVKIKEGDMKPAAAVQTILLKEPKAAPSDAELRRLRKALSETLVKHTGRETLEAIQKLKEWYGIADKKGDKKAERIYPLYHTAFQAIRYHLFDNSDTMLMEELGPIAEDMVVLAKRMWNADTEVYKLVTDHCRKDLVESGLGNKVVSIADMKFTDLMGVKEALTNVAYAAQDCHGDTFSVQALSSLAWGLSEAGVQNRALSTKVARGIIADTLKLSPPDIHKLWASLNEHKWFQDETAEAYLAESLVAQVQELKKKDAAINQMTADAVTVAEAAATER